MPLGKSLDNILSDYFGNTEVSLTDNSNKQVPDGSVYEIFVNQIEFNPYQTRTVFEQEKIQSLAKNISENGLIQPIVVLQKKITETTKPVFILLAGERRLRAVRILGWEKILAVVKKEDELNEKQQAMLSAMENLQREDLTPIELANTFKMLILTQNLSEDDLAQMLGTSKQYVKNYLRLLELGQAVKDALLESKIGEGQARHLVGLSESKQEQFLAEIIEKNLTVKEIIQLIKKDNTPEKPTLKNSKSFHNLPIEIVNKAGRLAENIAGSKLKCVGDEQKGKIVISWDNTKNQS